MAPRRCPRPAVETDPGVCDGSRGILRKVPMRTRGHRQWESDDRRPGRRHQAGTGEQGRLPESLVGARGQPEASDAAARPPRPPRPARPARPPLFRRRAGGAKTRPFQLRAPEVVMRRRRGRKWTRPAKASGAAGGRLQSCLGAAGAAQARARLARRGLGCPWGAGGRAGDAGCPWTPLRTRCLR